MTQLTEFPWQKSHWQKGEAGLTYLSLQEIAKADPAILFIQSYSQDALLPKLKIDPNWQRLRAVRTGSVYEVEPYWHWGNGTHLIRLMLDRLLPLIYPERISAAASTAMNGPSRA
ncbi:MAG: hypothetical protein AAF766_16755 [Cyanobacteria bacterium P01_D01_bin.14]